MAEAPTHGRWARVLAALACDDAVLAVLAVLAALGCDGGRWAVAAHVRTFTPDAAPVATLV
jgi:hypothetical protein